MMETTNAQEGDLLRETKHLRFIFGRRKPKTIEVYVENKSGEELGIILWYAQWRQYCYLTTPYEVVLAKSCLTDINQMIEDLMRERGK